jgi:hypothetical protein
LKQGTTILAALLVLGGIGPSWGQDPAPAAPPSDELEVKAQPAPVERPAPPAGERPALLAGEAQARRQAAQERELEALRARVGRLETPPPPPPPAVRLNEESAAGDAEGTLPLAQPGFLLSGYAQAQYLNSQVSQDQLQQGGASLNQDQFVVRRARVRFDRRWRHAAVTLELDGNTVGGLAFGLRRAEASLIWDGGQPVPLAVLTAGLFYTPFGYELSASARTRIFAERTLASSALFPGQGDVGVRFAGGWRFLRYAVAVVNGEPVAETGGRLFRGDPNRAKDVVGRLGVDVDAGPLRVAGGVSFLDGKGFHPGTEATKNGTVWRDINENSQIDAGEVTPVPGSAATPSSNFRRWAVGADLRLALRTSLGETRLFGELVAASNLDRGLVVADPVAASLDLRELGFHAGLLQQVRRWGWLGFRADAYDPNADFLDSRAGRLLPSSLRVTTLSPLVGVQVGERTRIIVQYDHVLDKLARDGRGVPANLKNDLVTARLQVEL